MSDRRLATSLAASSGRIALAAIAGGLVGLTLGLATQPTYEATASVLVADRGAQADAAGAEAATPALDDQRLLALARSDQVARRAAEALGDDLAGADLLARTEFAAGAGGELLIRSRADSPDLAAAAADAFQAAIIDRRRLVGAGPALRAGVEPALPEDGGDGPSSLALTALGAALAAALAAAAIALSARLRHPA